jgi:hypothetical protein
MTLNDLKWHGWTIVRNKKTEFFDLYMQSFIARIERHNTKFRVIDVHTNVEFPFVGDVSTLIAQIQQWHKTLKYSPHTYNPNYAKGYREDFQVREMMERHGFCYSTTDSNTYVLKDSDCLVEKFRCVICIDSFVHNEKGMVSVMMFTSPKQYDPTAIHRNCKTVEEIENFVLTLMQSIAIITLGVYFPFMQAKVDVGSLEKFVAEKNNFGQITFENKNLKEFFIERLKSILQNLESQ